MTSLENKKMNDLIVDLIDESVARISGRLEILAELENPLLYKDVRALEGKLNGQGMPKSR